MQFDIVTDTKEIM